MQWKIKTFSELSIEEFHNILQLRISVFVVEQDCPYPELDGKDKKAWHLFAVEEENPEKIRAYSRIFKPGDYYSEAAIGRVVVDPTARGISPEGEFSPHHYVTSPSPRIPLRGTPHCEAPSGDTK